MGVVQAPEPNASGSGDSSLQELVRIVDAKVRSRMFPEHATAAHDAVFDGGFGKIEDMRDVGIGKVVYQPKEQRFGVARRQRSESCTQPVSRLFGRASPAIRVIRLRSLCDAIQCLTADEPVNGRGPPSRTSRRHACRVQRDTAKPARERVEIPKGVHLEHQCGRDFLQQILDIGITRLVKEQHCGDPAPVSFPQPFERLPVTRLGGGEQDLVFNAGHERSSDASTERSCERQSQMPLSKRVRRQVQRLAEEGSPISIRPDRCPDLRSVPASRILDPFPPFATLRRVLPTLQYSALGHEIFRDEVLVPAATLARMPLEVGVWHPPAGIHPLATQARKARYRSVNVGYRWGPVWSSAWFRLRGKVQPEMAGQRVAVRFSSGTEATLWLDGRPFQGFDPYRELAFLLPKAKLGERVDLLIEAACNLPLGISTFWWDHPELHRRWAEENPGRLEAAELVVVDEKLWRFATRWDLLRKTLLALPPDGPRALAIKDGLQDIARSIHASDPRPGMRTSSAALDRLLRGSGTPTQTTCVAVGHAHIDTAWLWPVRETRRKCLRTFASVLRLIERFDQFHFICSQAQQYAWVEEDSPKLFAEITRQVQAGRFEPTGAMWIEPDCTCPSGESFIRQILHGVRYWSSKFDNAAPQRMLYLPDTFGFPPCLPQIARLAGLDTFITNKMSWSESNRFPHVTFRWRGLDGTELLTHLTPGHNYNSSLEPADLLLGERNLVTQDGHSFAGRALPIWLQPYGFGDGGGGPTAEQIERANAAAATEGLPHVQQHAVGQFCAELHEQHGALRADGHELAVWDGELYLELHRGTYTSQTWIKRQNRFAESLLRDVESLVCSSTGMSGRTRESLRTALDPLWKLVLLNQFHDILPGSSIAEVYADARAAHIEVAEEAAALRDELIKHVSTQCETRGMQRPVLVRNPASTDRGGVIELDGTCVAVDGVPAFGCVVVDAAHPPDGPPVRISKTRQGFLLQNAWIEAAIDRQGRIADLRMHGRDRGANARTSNGGLQPLNQLWLYEDRPRRWDAWDVDRDYMQKGVQLTDDATIEIVTAHPLRAELRVQRAFGRGSTLVQTYRLDAGARRIEIRTAVDWQEERTMLRALFPVDVRARSATFGTQFGALERATHRNTSWDEARFEVPGHAWMDLSESGFGVAILDDGKYGRSCIDNVLGLSLLRSPAFPDPGADRGEQAMSYALMLHDGDWRLDGVDAEAEGFREPLRVTPLGINRRGTIREAWAPLRLDVPQHAAVHIAAWKPAENGGGRVLRLVETRGGRGIVSVRWQSPVGNAVPVDVLERPFAASADPPPPANFTHHRKAAQTSFEIRPFQIVSILVRDV